MAAATSVAGATTRASKRAAVVTPSRVVTRTPRSSNGTTARGAARPVLPPIQVSRGTPTTAMRFLPQGHPIAAPAVDHVPNQSGLAGLLPDVREPIPQFQDTKRHS